MNHQIVVHLPGYVAAKAPAPNTSATKSGDVLDAVHPFDVWLEDPLQALAANASPVTVTVVGGQTATADDIVLYPQGGTVDNVGITVVTPDLSQGLPAETNVELEFGVHYSLQSSPEALLVLSVGYDDVLLAADAVLVTQGAGTETITLSFDVPHAPVLTFETLLFDEYLRPLAQNVQLGHDVIGAQQPQAPRLSLVSKDATGVTMRWSGGNVVNFKEFRILRTRGETGITPSSDPIAIITDPTVTSFKDTTIDYGEIYTYALLMETQDGEVSMDYMHLVVHTADLTWTEVPMNAEISDIVVDPVRERVYGIERPGNRVAVISTSSRQLESWVSLNCRVGNHAQVTPDGSYLFLSCPNAGSLVRLTLTGSIPTVDYYDIIASPDAFALAPDGKYLYLASSTEPQVAIVDVANPNKREIQSIDSIWKGLAFTPDGSFLIASGIPRSNATIGYVRVYDADQLEPVRELHHGRYVSKLLVHPTRDEAYIGTDVYNYRTGELLGATEVPVQFIGASNDVLYGWEPSGWSKRLIMFYWNGYAWTRHAAISSPADPRRTPKAMSPDEQTAYYASDQGIMIADLSRLDR